MSIFTISKYLSMSGHNGYIFHQYFIDEKIQCLYSPSVNIYQCRGHNGYIFHQYFIDEIIEIANNFLLIFINNFTKKSAFSSIL
jgi:hypothetical protein